MMGQRNPLMTYCVLKYLLVFTILHETVLMQYWSNCKRLIQASFEVLIKFSDLPNLHYLTETLFSLVALLYVDLLIVWRVLTCFQKALMLCRKKSKQKRIYFSVNSFNTALYTFHLFYFFMVWGFFYSIFICHVKIKFAHILLKALRGFQLCMPFSDILNGILNTFQIVSHPHLR